MPKTIEEKVRSIEDTLLILPIQLEAINDNQLEIKEHLENINGTFGEFDERLRSVETIQDYDDMRKGEKKEGKRAFLNLSNFILALVVGTQGIIVSVLALS